MCRWVTLCFQLLPYYMREQHPLPAPPPPEEDRRNPSELPFPPNATFSSRTLLRQFLIHLCGRPSAHALIGGDHPVVTTDIDRVYDVINRDVTNVSPEIIQKRYTPE